MLSVFYNTAIHALSTGMLYINRWFSWHMVSTMYRNFVLISKLNLSNHKSIDIYAMTLPTANQISPRHICDTQTWQLKFEASSTYPQTDTKGMLRAEPYVSIPRMTRRALFTGYAMQIPKGSTVHALRRDIATRLTRTAVDRKIATLKISVYVCVTGLCCDG